MPNKPDVGPYNSAEFYPYYEDRSANPLLMFAVRALTRIYYSPTIGEEDGAISLIGELARDGYGVVYSYNHICIGDQNALGSALLKRKELRPTARNIFFPAKLAYFQGKYRWFFDNTNSLPLTRLADVDDDKTALMVPNRHFQALAVKKIIAGEDMGISYAGTRSKDPESRDTLEEVMKGPAFIACRASKSVPVALVSVGLWYGSNDPEGSDWRYPSVYFCSPQIGSPESPFKNKIDVYEELVSNSAKALQRVIEMTDRQTREPVAGRV